MTVSRPMLWLSAAFLAGMYTMALLGATAACIVFFCLLIASLIQGFRKKTSYDNILLAIFVFLYAAGAVRYGVTDDIRSKKLFPFVEEVVHISGEVTDKPRVGENYVSMRLQVDTVNSSEKVLENANETVSFVCFLESDKNRNIRIPERGDTVTVSGVLSVPESALNTGGFDTADYLKSESIFFNMVGESETLSVTGHNKHFFSDLIYTVRLRCASLFDATFPAKESGVLKAYVLGDKSGMQEHVKDVFSVSGLSHVLAVSGMHAAVFISIITTLFTILKLSKRKKLFISAVAVLLFVVFTGASVSVIRTGFVCVLSFVAQLLYKRSDPLTALAEAAAVLGLITPHVIMSASFLLSFSATLGILLFAGKIIERYSGIYQKFELKSKRRKMIKSVLELTAVGLSAQVFVIPILIFFFRSFSTVSVVATILLTPLLAPLLAGGLLFCILGFISKTIALPVAGFLFALTKCMIWIAECFASLSISKIMVGRLTPYFIWCYTIFILLLIALFKRKRRLFTVLLSGLACLSVIFLIHANYNYKVASVSFMNVGQGDCTLIQAPGNCDVLLDAGGKEGDYSVGEEVILPYLERNNIKDIEYAIASHGHADHINGFISLMELTEIKHFVVPEGFGTTKESQKLLEEIKKKKIPITKMRHGEVLKLGNGMEITTVLPDAKTLTYIKENDENNRSMLLRLSYGNVSFLFAGDLSETGESYACAHYGKLLHANVMKASHHGSDSSNTEQFLDCVKPDYVFIPVGKNTYGHPGEEVLKRYIERNITYYRADKEKDVTFYFDTERICGVVYQGGVS